VLVTGHTGFKGAWLSLWLQSLGARVTGLADCVPTQPSLYALARVGDGLHDVRADIRDHAAVLDAVTQHAPEIVIHMAAQSLVRRSFADPRSTYETNVMGTVNVLEAVRATPSVRVVMNVTSDKCYDNDSSRPPRPFVEDDPKGGHDPYSNSKGCAELVAHAYLCSFFAPGVGGSTCTTRLGSVRAGNVIGGGDWADDRLVPDIMRPVRWSPDGRSLNYLRDTQGGVTNLWSLPLDDKPPKQLTEFKADQIYNFAWSPDGKQLVLARGTTTSDVLLIKDFR